MITSILELSYNIVLTTIKNINNIDNRDSNYTFKRVTLTITIIIKAI